MPSILSWCPYNQSCKGNLCQLWDQNEEECLLRLEILLRIKTLKLECKKIILDLRRVGKK